MQTWSGALVATLAATLAAGSAFAGQVFEEIQTFRVLPDNEQTGATEVWGDLFDPSVGTLTGVSIGYAGTLTPMYSIYGAGGPPPATIAIAESVSLPAIGSGTGVASTPIETIPVHGGNGEWRAVGTAAPVRLFLQAAPGPRWIWQPGESLLQALLAAPSALPTEFQGQDFNIAADTSYGVGTLTITYTYVPAPEPSSLAPLIAGLLGLGAIGMCRRARGRGRAPAPWHR